MLLPTYTRQVGTSRFENDDINRRANRRAVQTGYIEQENEANPFYRESFLGKEAEARLLLLLLFVRLTSLTGLTGIDPYT